MLILSYENEFNLHVKEVSFSYERMSTKTRFEEEAKGNSEMAYYKAKNISCAALSSILGDNSRTSPHHPPRTQRKVEVLERWP